MALFQPWKPKSKHKSQAGNPNTLQAVLRRPPQTPRQVASTPRSQPPSARTHAPIPDRFGGPAEMLGVCLHNFPAPLLDPDHPQYQQIDGLPRHNGKVFRTAHINVDDLAYYRVGRVFRWKAWVCCTKEKVVVHQYRGASNCIFILHLTEASHAADVSQRSDHPEEGEVVIAPYQQFQVASHDTRNNIHYLHCNVYENCSPPGFHLLVRSNQFETDELADMQEDVITLAERCHAILSPIYFEKQNEYAVAYIQHCEDNMEWKLVVTEDCCDEFLVALKCAEPSNRISVLVFTQDTSRAPQLMSAYPFVVDVTKKEQRILEFIQQPTISTPEAAITTISPDSTGGASAEDQSV